MNDRSCIVTRTARPRSDLLRFVAGPDGVVVPDLKGNLPGRGCWVTASRRYIEQAVRKKAFSRGLKASVTAPDDLADEVDRLMQRRALAALSLARKAGDVVTGATKVDSAVRAGQALAVLHSTEAAEDGRRKLANARRATVALDGPDIPAMTPFSVNELSLALGVDHVIHAAILGGGAGKAAFNCLEALSRYRDGSAGDQAGESEPTKAAPSGGADTKKPPKKNRGGHSDGGRTGDGLAAQTAAQKEQE